MSPEHNPKPSRADAPMHRLWSACALLGALLFAAGCDGAYRSPAAPSMRLMNVSAITDSLQRSVTLPGDGVAVIEVANPGPAMRVEEFRFVLSLGDAEYGRGRFSGNVLVNENGARTFNVPIVSQYIPAVRMALNRVKPLRITSYTIAFVDGNGQRRVEQWPAPPTR